VTVQLETAPSHHRPGAEQLVDPPAWVHAKRKSGTAYYVTADSHQCDPATALLHEPTPDQRLVKGQTRAICGWSAKATAVSGQFTIYLTCPDCGRSLARRGLAIPMPLSTAKAWQDQYDADVRAQRARWGGWR
jgi:hypothetical protein